MSQTFQLTIRPRVSANNSCSAQGTVEMRETFIGEAIIPVDRSFSTSAMAMGKPGLPRTFSWRERNYSVAQVIEEWKRSGDCRHGSGERYVRQHWFRIRTAENLEMKIYFERQRRSSGGSRWRLYSIQSTEPLPSSQV